MLNEYLADDQNRREGRLVALCALTVTIISVTTWFGLSTGRGAGRVPAVWWSNAVLLAILLLADRRSRWPLLVAGYLGNVIGHLLMHDPVSQVILLSLCDIGETAFGVIAVQWQAAPSPKALKHQQIGLDLDERGRLLRFVVFAVFLGPLLAACFADAILWALVRADFMTALRWWAPSALGMAIITPLILGLARPETKTLFARKRLLKTVALLSLLAVSNVLIFNSRDFPWLFLVFPPLILLVVELGVGGGALGASVVAAIGSLYTVAGHGVLASNVSTERRILILQLFLATAVLSVDVVGLVLGDLRRSILSADRARADLHRTLKTLEEVARLDSITGISNRRRFDEVLEREWRRGARAGTNVALLLFDIDHFKKYNDLYGHVAGDECLRKVARLASSVLRRPGDLLARYGGEEFAIILPETTLESAREIAESVLRRVRHELIQHNGSPEYQLTVSVGCVMAVPPTEGSAVRLVEAADAALYRAKETGRNRVVTDTPLLA